MVALYKDMPMNSDLASFDGIIPMGNEDLDDWSSWAYPYYLKAS